MKKIRRIAFLLFISGLLVSCSLLDSTPEELLLTDQSHIDFLVGVQESGILKKECHFAGTDDFDVDSEIEFVYKNNNLIEKIFTDYKWGDPVITLRDTFIYTGNELSKCIQYLRTNSPENPLELDKTYQFYYPDENTKIKIIHQNSENDKDSIVYVYSGNLITEEKCYLKSGIQSYIYSYNADNKLFKIEDITNELTTINYFDKDGVLESTRIYKNGEIFSELTYQRKVNGNRLTIERYLKYGNMNQPTLNSVKIFENSQLIEWVEHRSTTFGAEWWSTRYDYF